MKFVAEYLNQYKQSLKLSFDEVTRKKIEALDKQIDTLKDTNDSLHFNLDHVIKEEGTPNADKANNLRGKINSNKESIKKLEDQKEKIKKDWHQKNDK